MEEDTKAKKVFEETARELPRRVPSATYRLQFHGGFGFLDAAAIVPYLDDLGITDVYCSPFLKARKGSLHGYDIIDHNSLNPEVGTEEDYGRFCAELNKRGMGQLLDIVPNHMCIAGSDNRWWMDVLENGPGSPYASYFDIDWRPVKEELEDRVIVPILGDHYGNVLEKGDIRLSFEEGAFFVNYYGYRLPVDPGTYDLVLEHRIEALRNWIGEGNPHFQELLSVITALGHLPERTKTELETIGERRREKEIIKKRLFALYMECREFTAFLDENVRIFNGRREDPRSFDLLDRLLSAQVFRLSFWQVATEEINYRRFFDINDLAAIKMEDPAVFGEAHRLVFRLIREGRVTALRVDHPDGLYNPREYFERLQEECFIELCMGALEDEVEGLRERIRGLYREASDKRLRRPFYIVGEKILTSGEQIPEDWPVFGITGYAFMNFLNGLFVEGASKALFDGIYSRFIREKPDWGRLVYEKKKLIMETSMSGETNSLGHELNRISEKDRRFRDFTLNSLIDAVTEVIACFPVYRTYASASGINERDRRYIEAAVLRARRLRHDMNPSLFTFIRDILTLEYPDRPDGELRRQCLEFAMKLQQLTGPVMAKGLEDTAFYVFNRLLSLNEVGGDPGLFGVSPGTFHEFNAERSKFWPLTLIATSTHDSKRGEGARARLNVLSELPLEWKEHLSRWNRLNRRLKAEVDGNRVPDRNEEYLFYQTLLAAWPVGMAGEEFSAFKTRIRQYIVKAAREAKTNTNWINPDAEYEEALVKFADSVLGSSQFIEAFTPFQRKISYYGMLNSLSQTLIKIAAPGIPDFYQGTELWSLSLVDPDNRAPVDFPLRVRLLDELKEAAESDPLRLAGELVRDMEDGRIKLYLIYKALNFRRRKSALFSGGEYVSVKTGGRHGGRAFSFARTKDGGCAVVVAQRLPASFIEPFKPPVGDIWEDTYIVCPVRGGLFRDIFTGRTLAPSEREGQEVLHLRDVLSHFPVSMLEQVEK